MTRISYRGPKKARRCTTRFIREAAGLLEGAGMSLRHGKRTIIVNVDTKPELFDEVPCLGSSIPDAASMNIHYTGPSDWIIEELCFHETTHLYVPDTYTEDDVEALTAALLSVKRIMEASGVRKEET